MAQESGRNRRQKPPTWLRAVGLVFRPLRALTAEVAGVRLALENLVALEEYATQRRWPRPAALEVGEGEVPVVDVSYTTDAEQVQLAEIELQLTAARGAPPSEDEIVAEFDRRRMS